VCLTPSAVASEWVRREVFTARAQNKPVLPLLVKKQGVTAAGVPVQTLDLILNYDETRILREIQMVDFERYGYAAAFRGLLDALPSLTKSVPPTAVLMPETAPPAPTVTPAQAGTAAIDPAAIANPFKGLESFQQTDAHLFFGREELTERLIRRLDEQGGDRFVAVVGASGSGKSSLVRAGVIPKLRDGALPGSSEWLVAIFTPGESPTQSLALRLLPILKNQLLPTVLAALNQGSAALDQLAEGVLADADPTARLLLVVDQFEEVFTRASDSEAQKFLDLLVTAVTTPHADGRGRVFAVLTMRADFFDRLSGYPALARLFEDENLLIATEMTPDALRRSIEMPAAAVGLVYDHGLVDMILEDVRQQPGSLPLMEYALKRLYEARDGRRLTKTAYTAMGGVQGALAVHAEALYMAMAFDTQAAVRRILLGLVEVSATGEATRRRVNRSALNFRDIPVATVDSVIATLSSAGNRLLITNREVGVEGTVAGAVAQAQIEVQIEVAHEALLRQWRTLAGWITADKADLYYGGELLKDAQEWRRAAPERQAEYALMGMRLREAQSWLTRADANDDQRQFIAASADEEARQLAAEEMRKEELRLVAERAEAAQREARQNAEEAARALAEAKTSAQNAERQRRTAVTAQEEARQQTAQAQQAGADAKKNADNAERQRRRALTATRIAVVVLVLAVAAGMFAGVQTNTANTAQAQVETQVAALNAIVPGATQGAVWRSLQANADLAIRLQFSENGVPTGVTSNGEWTPVPQDFDGVTMMQVPAGCFLMGSSDGDSDEQPVSPQCFSAPFWIDQTEVTQTDFERLGGVKARANSFDGDQRPVERITWFEARAFCALRGGRLPTEAEWEYAARGPDALVYPWGNDWIPDNAVWDGNANDQTASVGSRPAGGSWVGAQDMSGNVWEWVSTIYSGYGYPYNAADGREDVNRTNVSRVLRGGSWFVNVPTGLRAAIRYRLTPDFNFNIIGVRCALS